MFWRSAMRKKQSRPRIFVFFGLIASGKSTLAHAWAARLGIPHFNSDRIRKDLAGEKESSGRHPFRQGIYTVSFTEKTYAALGEMAEKALQQGDSVVLDASYRQRSDREYIRGLAKKHGACARFILCSCPEPELKRRMEERARDPEAISDGRWEIYLQQKKVFEPPDELTPGELISLPTMGSVDLLLDKLSTLLAE